MKSKAIYCILLSASLSLAQGPGAFVRGGGPGGRGPGGFGPERVVTGAPFSGVEVRQFQETLADGTVINRTSQTTLYRDSQGRTRTETTVTPDAASGKQPFTMVTISDPVAGKRYTFESNSNTYRTARIPVSAGNSASNTQVRRTPPGSSSSSASSNTAVRAGRGGAAITKAELGSQMKNGALATGSRETEVIAAGKIGNSQPITVTRETWYSTELKRNVEVKVSDPQHGNSTTELTNLVQAEPSAALFTVPAGYTESAGRGPRGGAFARGGRPKPAQ